MLSGKPDGIWKSFYPNGKLKSVGKWKNSFLDSIWVFYDVKGRTEREISYFNGQKSGLERFYSVQGENVYLQRKSLYLAGKKSGFEFIFDSKGLREVSKFKNGAIKGNKFLFQDSQIKQISEFRNGEEISNYLVNQRDSLERKTGIWIKYNSRFVITEKKEFKNGVLDGQFQKFDDNGIIVENNFFCEGVISNSEIKFKLFEKYSKDSILNYSGYFADSVPIGLHKHIGAEIRAVLYDEYGKKVAEGFVDDNDLKTGLWKFFYDDLAVSEKGNFCRDKKTGNWNFYFKNGILEQKGFFNNDLKTGKWIWYYSDEKIKRFENFKNSVPNGKIEEFDDAGNLILSGNFEEGLRNGKWFQVTGEIFEEGNYVDDLKNGSWKAFFSSEQIKFAGKFIYGQPDGKHLEYYKTGIIKAIEIYENGVKQGVWIDYNEDGTISGTSVYKADKLVRVNGIKVNETYE